MSGARLPARIEVAAIRRLAESMGGFATVLGRGERDAGAIAIVLHGRDRPSRLYERLPTIAGDRAFELTLEAPEGNPGQFEDRLRKRRASDPDLWLIEVDVPEWERFVAALPR